MKIKSTQAALDHYNDLLMQADLEGDRFDTLEKEPKDLSERMLTGVNHKWSGSRDMLISYGLT